jgi:hypothetical protein
VSQWQVILGLAHYEIDWGYVDQIRETDTAECYIGACVDFDRANLYATVTVSARLFGDARPIEMLLPIAVGHELAHILVGDTLLRPAQDLLDLTEMPDEHKGRFSRDFHDEDERLVRYLHPVLERVAQTFPGRIAA